MAQDENGNELPGSGDTSGGQGTPSPDKVAELEKQMADLIAANKKQTADFEIQREENQRLQNLLISMRDGSGDGSDNSRRPAPTRGRGRFNDPAYKSEFERKYSLPAEAAEEIIEESVSRFTQAQQDRETAIRNGEKLKNDFFKKYPDLADYVPIVRHFSDQCANEHPDWNVAQGFIEVAKLSREYIKSKLGTPSGREEPPEVLPSGSGSSRSEGGAPRLPGSPEGPAVMPTQDDEIRAEMDARKKNRSKAL